MPFAALLGLLAASGSAQAGNPPNYLRLCTTEGAFGVRFGQEVTVRETDILPIRGSGFAPFTRREAIAGPAGRVFEVIGYAELGSEQRATALGAAIRAQLVAAGWEVTEDELGMSFRRPGADGAAQELRIFMGIEYQRVTVDCMRADLRRAAAGQRPPDPERRPVAPERPALPAGDIAACDDPARRAALMTDPQQFVLPAMEYGSLYRRHIGAMVAWWGGQLMRSARWTEAQRSEFEGRLASLPDVAAAMEGQAAAFREVMTSIDGAMADDLNSAGACRTGVTRQNALRRIVEGSEAILAAIEAAYRAEATRLGATLN